MEFQVDGLLRLHLRIFQFFGYFPFALNAAARAQPEKVRRCERLLKLWTVLLLIVYSIAAVVAFSSDDEFLFTGDLFGYFNDALKIICGQVAVSVIFVETLQQRAAQRQFWLHYQRVHWPRQGGCGGGGGGGWWAQLRQHQRFVLCFYGLVIAECVSLLLFLLYQRPMHRHLILFWAIFEPYIVWVRVRLFQCLLHVELLRQELAALAADLRLVADYTRYACRERGVLPFPRYVQFLRGVLRVQQLRYTHIYEMYVAMQQAYGRSMLATLTMIYVRIVVDTYFAYYTIYRGWCMMENFMLLTSCHEIPIFLLSSRNCMAMIEEVTYQLHQIKTILPCDAPHSGFSKQLQNFSLQILHLPLRIDGLGIAPFDGYMLTKAIGSITMYMIFFIQFMPKFVNIPKEGMKA